MHICEVEYNDILGELTIDNSILDHCRAVLGCGVYSAPTIAVDTALVQIFRRWL